jgi:hypothetical protein
MLASTVPSSGQSDGEASVPELTLSFRQMFRVWLRTVLRECHTVSAICCLVRPVRRRGQAALLGVELPDLCGCGDGCFFRIERIEQFLCAGVVYVHKSNHGVRYQDIRHVHPDTTLCVKKIASAS